MVLFQPLEVCDSRPAKRTTKFTGTVSAGSCPGATVFAAE
jgi:hypothetical protein